MKKLIAVAFALSSLYSASAFADGLNACNQTRETIWVAYASVEAPRLETRRQRVLIGNLQRAGGAPRMRSSDAVLPHRDARAPRRSGGLFHLRADAIAIEQKRAASIAAVDLRRQPRPRPSLPRAS
ncbi:hypothetical protein BE04_21325 [Sorangium cellulosum]|uniref:Secreted protein n=2 Tax=Sorangium cellulosum TaxID=56 RepID=A0A150Q7G1_SORCE|nr:hypothetical protein [Sorangium cellulosum]AGP40961.1 hypothetical protein SCE1572_44595 [Sorangium cellulosum So0157-2]KYF63890.1 hypothetical protein BE04_21325 [Sorangium cellulosum]